MARTERNTTDGPRMTEHVAVLPKAHPESDGKDDLLSLTAANRLASP